MSDYCYRRASCPTPCRVAVNSLGYEIQALTNIGWLQAVDKIFGTKCLAERHMMTMTQPGGRELRAYEVLSRDTK